MFKKVKRFFSVFGPGVITGAADDDPSGIGTYSVAGASYGFAFNWVCTLLVPLMVAVQEMCARIGLVTGKGLAGVIRLNYAKPILLFATTLLLVANTINIGADIGAMGAVLQMILPFNLAFWAIISTVAILLLEVFFSYKVYSKILKWLVISLFAYILTALVIRPCGLGVSAGGVCIDWGSAIKHMFIPTINLSKEFLLVFVGFLGTSISPYLFFWQASEEVEEEVQEHKIFAMGKGRPKIGRKDLKDMRFDNFIGMLFSQVATFFIVVTTAATLFATNHRNIQSAAEAAGALKPLAGNFAYILFAVGILGVGLLGIPVLAGSAAYALSEGFGWREGLYLKFKRAHGFYGVITIATLVGLLINFVGINPIKALLYAAVVNGVIAVPLIAIIIFISNNKKIMGERVSGIWSNAFGWIAFGLMGLAAAAMIFTLL